MRIILLLLITVISVAVNAHTGHGSENIFIHAMDHSIWYTGIVVFIMSCLVLAIIRRR